MRVEVDAGESGKFARTPAHPLGSGTRAMPAPRALRFMAKLERLETLGR